MALTHYWCRPSRRSLLKVTVALLVMPVLLFSACSSRPQALTPAQVPPPATPPPKEASPEADPADSILVSGHTIVSDLHPGEVQNQIRGEEDDLSGTTVDESSIEPAPFGRYLTIRLTGSSKASRGVKVQAIDSEGTVYSKDVQLQHIRGNESAGYILDVGFENKPWSTTQDWIIRVFCGTEQVFEQFVSVPPMQTLIYDKFTDDPLQETDTKELARGHSYKVAYQYNGGNVLIIYYAKDFGTYRAVYVGKADPPPTDAKGFDLKIADNAASGQYYFVPAPPYGIDETASSAPVYEWREVQ
jgi:hypothetical protein